MIAGRYTQGGQLQIVDVPMPRIGDDELLLRVEASAICGSDVKIIRHGHHKLQAGQTLILGHEFVGTIEESTAQSSGFPLGTRVGVVPNIGCGSCEMCRRELGNMCPEYEAFGITFDGGHAQFVRIPASAIRQGNVVPVPETIPAVDASLIEPLSCAVNSMRVAQVSAGDAVLIYGAGPMGLLNAMVASAAGAGRVVVVDFNESRLQKAKTLGVTDTVNPKRHAIPSWVADETGGRGMDAVVVAVPVGALQQEGLGLLAPFGRLCLFAGLPRGQTAVGLDTNLIHYRNLVVTGMTGGAACDYRQALELIRSKKVDVAPIVSHVFSFDDMQAAYKIALAGEGMKIVLASVPGISAPEQMATEQ